MAVGADTGTAAVIEIDGANKTGAAAVVIDGDSGEVGGDAPPEQEYGRL